MPSYDGRSAAVHLVRSGCEADPPISPGLPHVPAGPTSAHPEVLVWVALGWVDDFHRRNEPQPCGKGDCGKDEQPVMWELLFCPAHGITSLRFAGAVVPCMGVVWVWVKTRFKR